MTTSATDQENKSHAASDVQEAKSAPRLCQEAGRVLPAAVAHVAGRSQLAHARVHEREPRAPGAPALEALGVPVWLLTRGGGGRRPRLIASQAFRPLQPGSLFQGCVQEEVSEQRMSHTTLIYLAGSQRSYLKTMVRVHAGFPSSAHAHVYLDNLPAGRGWQTMISARCRKPVRVCSASVRG